MSTNPSLPHVIDCVLTYVISKEDYVKARDVAVQAAKSRAYLYPIKVCNDQQPQPD